MTIDSATNGHAFAETHFKVLSKFDKRGMLQSMSPFASLPTTPTDVDALVDYCAAAATRECRRDLEERAVAEPAAHEAAFIAAFSARLRELLLGN